MRKILPAVLSSLAVISYGALAAEGTQDTSKADQYLSQENKADPMSRDNVDANRDARAQRDAAQSDPVKPEIGAGPHRDRSAQTSGAGTAKPDAPPSVPPRPEAAGDSGASTGPSKPDTVQDRDDERKATQSKQKMKKKPGYQEEVPSPRASHTGLMFN